MFEMHHSRWGRLEVADGWRGVTAVPGVLPIDLTFTIEAEFEGPHEAQLNLLGEVVDRYAEFWPMICAALQKEQNRICEENVGMLRIQSRAELEATVTSHHLEILWMVGDKPDGWSFSYIFQNDELVYHIDFRDWKIIEVGAIY